MVTALNVISRRLISSPGMGTFLGWLQRQHADEWQGSECWVTGREQEPFTTSLVAPAAANRKEAHFKGDTCSKRKSTDSERLHTEGFTQKAEETKTIAEPFPGTDWQDRKHIPAPLSPASASSTADLGIHPCLWSEVRCQGTCTCPMCMQLA